MRKSSTLRIAAATLIAAVGLAVAPAMPAAAAPATHAVVADDGGFGPSRFGVGGFRRHRFGFPFAFGFPRFGFGFPGFGFGFRGAQFGFGGCDVFLQIGDIDNYILCRVG